MATTPPPAITTTPATDPAGLLGKQLRALLAEALGDPTVHIDGLRRVPAGASRHTFYFKLAGDRTPTQSLILRLDAPGSVEADAMGRETALMVAASQVGVPSPRVIVAGDEDSALGAAFVVMTYVEGETIPRKILRDPAYATTRPLLAGQCGQVLARIHSINPAAVPGLESRDELDTVRILLAGYGQPHPALELAIRWLDSHRPAAVTPQVVHGDFRNGNFIVGPEGIRAVLDWELAHLGDPLEDLGWLCTRAWRFGEEPIVGGFGSIEALVEVYEAHSGVRIDRDALYWWQVLATLKWAVFCIHQAERHRTGTNRSVELASIGRRVAENEWELLQLIP